MLYSTDYHIHTKYSDGQAAPEDYIGACTQKAMGLGFKLLIYSTMIGAEVGRLNAYWEAAKFYTEGLF